MVGEGLWDKKNLIDVHVVVPIPFVARRKRKLKQTRCFRLGASGKVLKAQICTDAADVHVLGWTRP